MKIYLAAPISGQLTKTVLEYFRETSHDLRAMGYEVLSPMVGKEYFASEQFSVRHIFKNSGYNMPTSTDHAIFNRDKWMVTSTDVLYANLTASDESSMTSIGSIYEIAWASLLHKHIVIAMGEGNIHRHAFVMESSHIVYKTHAEAMKYLKELKSGHV